MKQGYVKIIFLTIIFMAVSLLVFGKSAGYGYVGWDDNENVYGNIHYLPLTLASFIFFWTSTYFSIYMPITFSVWGLMVLVFGLGSPGAFHLLNIMVHALTVMIVYLIFERLFKSDGIGLPRAVENEVIAGEGSKKGKQSKGGRQNLSKLAKKTRKDGKKYGKQAGQEEGATGEKVPVSSMAAYAAFVGALFYAVHPLQVEAVTWITDLKDLLGTFFFFLAFLFYLAGKKRYTGKNTVLLVCFYVASMLSKPSMLMLPVLIVFSELFLFRSDLKGALKRYGTLLFLAIPVILVNKTAQSGRMVEELAFSIVKRIVVMFDSFGFYLYKVVWPLPLSIDYGRTPMKVLSEGVEGGWLFLSAGIGFLLLLVSCFALKRNVGREKALPWFGLFSFFVLVFPLSGIMPFIFQKTSTVADRYMHLPMFGIALLVAWLFGYLGRTKLARISVPLTSVLLLVLSVLSFTGVDNWRSTLELYKNALEHNPKSIPASYGLGVVYSDMGMVEKGYSYYIKATEIDPSYAAAWTNIGNYHQAGGRVEEARKAYLTALEKEPEESTTLSNLGAMDMDTGDFESAENYFLKAIEHDALNGLAYKNLASLYMKMDRKDEYFAVLEKAVSLDVRSGDIYFMLAESYGEHGNPQRTAAILEKGLLYDPGNSRWWNNLGILYARYSLFEKAHHAFENALRANPRFEEARNNLDRLRTRK